MMKISVSVPDELWAEAKSHSEDAKGSSHVVQAALRQWVAQQRRGHAMGGGSVNEDRLNQVASTLSAEYERTFRNGYDDALKVAEALGFEAVASYARWHDWEYVCELAPHELVEVGDQKFRNPKGPVPRFWDEVGLDEDQPADEVYASGAETAFADLWGALRSGAWRETGNTHEIERGDEA